MQYHNSKTYFSQGASPEATLNVPAAHAEQGPPSGPVYPAVHTLQSAAAFDPVPAVVLPGVQLHDGSCSNYGDGDGGGDSLTGEGTGKTQTWPKQGSAEDSLFTCRGTDRGAELARVAAVVKRRGGETGQRTFETIRPQCAPNSLFTAVRF